jgi:catechol 2,3-dioxygenase-like lactoylglutathione lyase family enzyme
MSTAMNHVAVSVTDIKRAMEWYRDTLGMSVLAEPVKISASGGADTDPHLAALVRNVFGPGLGSFLICHMITVNGVGIELFQFLEPRADRRQENFDYWRTGYFHIAITEPLIAELAERIGSNGGKKRTDVLELTPGSDKKICFCEDPFGNIIEIYSHSYEQFWSVAKR